MRTLGIDFGTRRVGLALSDAGGKLATPLHVIEISSPGQAIDQIIPIIKSEGVERVVVGLPLNMDDTIGPAAKGTIEWAGDLSSRANVPIIFVDERLSSFAAEQSMIDRKRGGEKITRKQKKQRLDAVAAAGFLQAFLDGKLAPLAIDD
ncbi:MAG TPA: Holliday junction resolvase RuvX [Tepidisphaeraceae bacterium]|nr:Holliday junction resolvase RuvX [Tepidisphaeraceae bacterium]